MRTRFCIMLLILLSLLIYNRSVWSEAVQSAPESTAEPAAVSAEDQAVTSVAHEIARLDMRRYSQPVYRETEYERIVNERLAPSLLKAAERAGTVAKTAAKVVGEYVREKQYQKKQDELLQAFYHRLYDESYPLKLSPEEHQRLVSRVEDAYIEDGDDGKYELDTTTFSDMPTLVRRFAGEMKLQRASDGIVDTYYDSGALKTRWRLKDGEPEGPVVTYYEDGEIKTIDIYEEGRRLVRRKYNADGKLEFEQKYDYDASVSAPESVL